LVGDGAAGTIIDGSQIGRVISVATGINVTISNLTIEGGRTADGGYGDDMLSGAGIYNNAGTLTLNNSVLSGNHTGKGAGFAEGGNGGGTVRAGVCPRDAGGRPGGGGRAVAGSHALG
jgi:hypothetical protein